ncbi:MAG: thioredoxin fold domain-containing protein [Candidatus Aminicenantes bacterium]|nr:thioredoxin fold domain-containing protein [Candidatus Aminicenantes bacterium]NIN20782.1 thioredoxin fold domain-containing protein [Candidatus Aminicenantes bacterium]NIN44560.1 thioredoxin fold domain-containing protein [Candidatus Aminicenantes bacterium]NIN87380.1 thioredoxin fold domain-containing protein [Candidatus Aminicenantes bacterium]NIR08223.1 thioredoxin fold domain-containing protein [Candidatus Aminicenantes bacterium]
MEKGAKMVKHRRYNKSAVFLSTVMWVYLFVLSFTAYGQVTFGDEPFSAAEPGIDTDMKYDDGLILFKFDMDPNHHITDLKHNFFRIEVEKNEYVEIRDVIFPKGVPYADENVFKGKFDVKVYIKSLKEIDQPVKLKFNVSYQVCQERPREVCFPPTKTDVDVTIKQTFKVVEPEKKAEKVDTGKASLKDLSTVSSVSAFKPKGGNWVVLLLVSLLLLAVSIFAGLSRPLADDGMGAKFGKALVVLFLLAGTFLFLKAMDIKYFPLKYSQKPKNAVTLKWISSIDEGKTIAKKENKPVMIDTYADWCIACKELEEYTFSHPEVAKVLEDYVLVKLDFTKMNAEDEKLQKDLNVRGMPTVIFLDPAGNETRRFSGFYNKDKFLVVLGVKKAGWFERLLELLKQELEKISLLLFALVFFLGFLTSLTPCVYPVIPIVMGYIGTRSGGKKSKGFYLSIFFVLGLAFVYSVFGVVAAMTGSMVGVSFQNPIVVIIIAAIFIVMGLSLAGLFEIPVPSSISSKVQSSGGKSEIISAVVIGGVAGIIAAPCVGPVLIALLSWISQTGNVFLGFLLTFIFSLGMGIIFLLVGTFSGVVSSLPKSGKWMDYVKYFFAIVLLGGGIFILNSIVPSWVNLLLWGIFLVGLSVFIGLFRSHEEYKIKNKIYKFVALLILLVGIFLFYKSLELKFFTASPNSSTVAEEVTQTQSI